MENKFQRTTNPTLIKIETDINAKVPKEKQAEFDKLVIAGEKMLFDKSTHANMQLIRNPESRLHPIETISEGVVGLVWLLYIQSRRKLSIESMVYGGIFLITKVMDFAERGLGIEITNEIISQTVQRTCEKLFERLGISPKELLNAIRNGRQEIIDYHKHQTYLNDKIQNVKTQKQANQAAKQKPMANKKTNGVR